MASSRSPQERQRRAGRAEGAGRTLAQGASLVIGLVLIAVGILGFFFGGSEFGVGGSLEGQEFIVFEVNGWHNVVHLATGAFLVLMAATARSAVSGLLIFGLVYAAVTVWGFIDGDNVANIIPVNPADNWLHVGLTAAALLIAVVSGGVLRKSSGTHG